jgi:ribosomal protein L19
MIAKIEVKRRGKVRRARLTYLRNKKVKKLKSQEVTVKGTEEEKPEEKKEERVETNN